jgi:hypothetical protein
MRASRVPAASDHGHLDALPAVSKDGFNSLHETNFGLVHTPDHTKANMRAYMWDKMKDWPARSRRMKSWRPTWRAQGITSTGAICWFWNRKPTMQKRGQASPDDGDALARTFTQPVEPAEVEEKDEEEEFGGYGGHSSSGGWMR